MVAELRALPRFSPAELGGLLDGMSTCIVWLDGDGAVLHLNEPAEDGGGVLFVELAEALLARLALVRGAGVGIEVVAVDLKRHETE